MKIVVIGGTGPIASGLVNRLAEEGHEATEATPSSGVNVLTGQGLARALRDASVVVDVSNPRSLEGASVLDFFPTATLNLLAEETAAGVAHHVALSNVGTNRLPQSAYFRARMAQEELIRLSSRPYTIVHATQLFEAVELISEVSTVADEIRLAPALVQPVAVEDVVEALVEISTGPPRNAMIEIAGPERFHLEEFIRHALIARDDPRVVVADPEALYLGAHLHERSLLPRRDARIGETRFHDWLSGPGGLIEVA